MRKDNEGNKIITEPNDFGMCVYLQLKSEDKKRVIGVINEANRTMDIFRDREKHLFRKGNAYGFNNYVLENATKFDTIILKDSISRWEVPVKFILENGRFLLFKQQGFEIQKFVSLEQLEQFKTI
jgi:hypothetical protein